MRTAPAVAVTVHRSSWWGAFVALLTIAAVAVLLAWAVQGAGVLRWFAAGAAAVFGGAVFMTEYRRPPAGLRWDRQCWQLDSTPLAAVREEVTCEIAVAIDLGDWMLLSLMHTVGRTHRTWLAVQRSSTDGDWHALRCAVYSPRPPRPSEADSLAPIPPSLHERR